MSTKKRIDRKKFLEVKGEIISSLEWGKYEVEAIAKKTGVGATTVRAVRRAGSWPKYQKLNEQRTAARKSRRQDQPAGHGLKGVPPVTPRPETRRSESTGASSHEVRINITSDQLDEITTLINGVRVAQEKLARRLAAVEERQDHYDSRMANDKLFGGRKGFWSRRRTK
ncbi:hypothetical protein ACFZAD_24475 [Streptomyces iakyrus]|uniref:hypothetical protein n=1 Tax=Streptomyces iakyrus TaxID=68219 RepID=UPI0036F03BE7